jgi:lysophospholipase L1-like esterase
MVGSSSIRPTCMVSYRRRPAFKLCVVGVLTATCTMLVPPLSASAVPAGTNGQIAYVAAQGSGKILLANPDGSNARRLTAGNQNESNPTYSADGSRIAFTSRSGTLTQQRGIVIANSDGTVLASLSDAGAVDDEPAFSPNGAQIAFISSRDDGTFRNGPEIYIMDSDGENPTRLTSNTVADREPTFSPDGDRIAFTSRREGAEGIYIMNRDGSDPVRLTPTADGDREPTFSPDGTRIAFTSTRDGDEEIYVTNVSGAQPVRLTFSDGLNFTPAFSPDGTKIAFASTRSGSSEIWTMNSDGTGQTQITNSADVEEYGPDWGSSGPPSGGGTPPLPPIPDDIEYVALGDSYSSGEGTFGYDGANEGRRCHRGDGAWPRQLAVSTPEIESITHRACTGARTQHLLNPWPAKRQPAQLPTSPDPAVDLVTLTIGGNDLGFGDIIRDCRFGPRPGCADDPQSRGFLRKLGTLRTVLSAVVYPALRRAYPNARIVHVGYPRVIPSPGSDLSSCNWLSRDEQAAAEQIVGQLNGVIQDASAASAEEIEYLDATLAMQNHELCTRDSWMVPITSRQASLRSTEQGHPNYDGQSSYARTVRNGLGPLAAR